jgi:addiction module HigA family antidote
MSQDQTDEFAPVTPGEILAEEYLAGYGPIQASLARALGISPNRIAEIVNDRRRITADTSLRLGLYFGTSPEFWQNLQARYALTMARQALSPQEAESIAAQMIVWKGKTVRLTPLSAES